MIAKLEKKKLEAVATERFEYAKKIKSAIGEIMNNGLVMLFSAPKLLFSHVLATKTFKSMQYSVSGELVEAGQMLASLQMEKRFAVKTTV